MRYLLWVIALLICLTTVTTAYEPSPVPQKTIEAISFSPDGKLLASAGWDGTVRIWEIKSGRAVAVLHKHKTWVADVCFSPDGKLLATCAGEAVRIWSTNGWRNIRTYDRTIYDLRFSPDGKWLLGGGWSGILVWESSTGRLVRKIDKLDSPLFLNDKTVIAEDSFRRVKISSSVNTDDRLECHINWRGPQTSPNGRLVACRKSSDLVVDTSHSLSIFSALTGEKLTDLRMEGEQPGLLPAAFSSDSAMIAIGGWDGSVKLWDIATSKVIVTLNGHKEAVTTLAYSPDGITLASGSDDGTVRLWYPMKSSLIRVLRGHEAKFWRRR